MDELNLKPQDNGKLLFGYVNSTGRKFHLLQEQLQIGNFCHFEMCGILVEEIPRRQLFFNRKNLTDFVRRFCQTFR